MSPNSFFLIIEERNIYCLINMIVIALNFFIAFILLKCAKRKSFVVE